MGECWERDSLPDDYPTWDPREKEEHPSPADSSAGGLRTTDEKLFHPLSFVCLTRSKILTTLWFMQKTLLWSLAGAVSLLLMVNLALGLNTRGSVSKIQNIQAQVANGPQLEMVLRNLSIRIAMAGEKDPAFKELLKKHELNVQLQDGAAGAGAR